MPGKTFVDTNILIYAHDIDAGKKHPIAKKVLAELWDKHEGVVSAQVLHEFYVNATRKYPSRWRNNSQEQSCAPMRSGVSKRRLPTSPLPSASKTRPA